MLKKLIRTNGDVSALVLRVMLGIVFLPHGAQKTLGWFGGHGFSATLNALTQNLHIPLILALLVIISESLGAIALIFGFMTRLAAFGLAAVMTGAIFMGHINNGFFMNWSGAQKGEGFEYHLLAIAVAVALMIKGAGLFSIDRKFSK